MKTDGENRRGLRGVVDWFAEHFGKPGREESFGELNDRYHDALGRWEEDVGAAIMLREWRKGNLFLDTDPRYRRAGDCVPRIDLSEPEIKEARKSGIELDEAFFARGQYSFEKLWGENSPADPALKRNEPDQGRDL